MLIAERDNARVEPSPDSRAICPSCKSLVISKCGEINVWHWAHEAADCDSWSEPESRWHSYWKSRFPAIAREVVIGNHRADIQTASGWVIELQNSSISSSEIVERERFYGRMIWIINAAEFSDNLSLRPKQGFITFRWKWPRKSWESARAPIFLDLGGEFLLRLRRIHWHEGRSAGGWAKEVAVAMLVQRALRGIFMGS